MKFKAKFLSLAILSLSAAVFSGCDKKSNSDNTPGPSEPAYKKNERAMDNFQTKLGTLSYKLEAGEARETSVVSDDIVILRNPSNSNKPDLFYMSVEGETFQAYLPKDESKPITHIEFQNKVTARKASEINLPSYWFDQEATGKTIWNLFQSSNPEETPFHYVAKQVTLVPESICTIAGLESSYASSMKNVYMDFDKEDVSVATIHATYLDDSVSASEELELNISVTFGVADSDSRIESWISSSSREYPTAVGEATSWENTKFATNLRSATKLQDDVDNFIPFIDFASYAVVDNSTTFQTTDKYIDKIRDYHGTEENVESYKEKLLLNQYSKIEVDGADHYRRVLRNRENKKICADLKVSFNEGFYLEVGLFYESDTYSSLDEFNVALTSKGFTALPQTDILSDWEGVESTNQAYESLMCLFNYKLCITISAKYSNKNAAQSYLDDYVSSLEETGYEHNKNAQAWIKHEQLHEWRFEYDFDGVDAIELKVNVQEFANPQEVKPEIETAGFPALGDDWIYVDEIKYLINYVKFTANLDCSLCYGVTFDFDNPTRCAQYRRDYIQAMKNIGFKISGSDEGMTYYSKDKLRVRVADPGSQSTFLGLNFYVFSE